MVVHGSSPDVSCVQRIAGPQQNWQSDVHALSGTRALELQKPGTGQCGPPEASPAVAQLATPRLTSPSSRVILLACSDSSSSSFYWVRSPRRRHHGHLHLTNPNVELFQLQRQGVGYLFSRLESMGYVALHDKRGLGRTATAITLADFGRGLWG